MKKIAFFFLALLLTTNLFAGQTDWNKFDHAFQTIADYQESQVGIYAVLENKEAIENGHQADYFSGVGGFDDNGTFWSYRYELVSEKWIQVGDKWHVDQWLIAYNSEKKLIYKAHIYMVRTEDGVILDYNYMPESEESYEQKANSLLTEWTNRIK